MSTKVEETYNALRLILPSDSVTELRIPKAGRSGTVSGYYSDFRRMAEDAHKWSGKADGVYFTLNPVTPSLLARAANRPVERAEYTTKDEHIPRCLRLLVDADAVRPAGISSSDLEHQHAMDRARAIRVWLRSKGWPDPFLADSGNGGHLIYRIDLPNTPEVTGLLKRVLAALAFKFDDSRVIVDTTTYNPSRICKLYGTLAAKGDDLPDRPHRYASILETPSTFEVVRQELLEEIASMLPDEPRDQRAHQSHNGSFDLDNWIQASGLEIASTGLWNGGRKWILRRCPWDSEHTDKTAYIVQFPSGAIGAGCLHQSCKENGWHELRDVAEPGWRERRNSMPRDFSSNGSKSGDGKRGDTSKEQRNEQTSPPIDLDKRVQAIVKAKDNERDDLIHGLAHDLVLSHDALALDRAGKALKDAKVLSLSTWRQLSKEERERQKQEKETGRQAEEKTKRETRLQEIISTHSDLLAIHQTMAKTTSSPHSHDVIELALADSISHLLPSEALLWLLIVGPPSSDKTQTALAIKDAPHIFHLDTLTENAFISGFVSPDGSATQDLLAELDGRCLTIKDLNALFGQHPDKVVKVLGDLTAIYDGEFSKWTGTRGNVSYAARFSLIGCVTPITLAQHHRYMNVIGPRFLSYRVAELSSEAVDEGFNTVWNGSGESKSHLRHLASAYAAQLHEKISKRELPIPIFGQKARSQLNAMARFLAHARAAVRTQRADIATDSGKTATVYDIVEVQREEPFRALLQLRTLAIALALVHQRSEVTEHELELCRRVVLSSMPYDRSLVLSLFQNSTYLTQNSGLTRKAAANGIGKARNQAVRLLTELEAIGVLKGEKARDEDQGIDMWTYHPASDEFRDILKEPIRALDHHEDLKSFHCPVHSFVSDPLTQNYGPATEEKKEDEGQGDTVARVRFMVTRDMQQQLADLGYKRSQIDAMTPDDAAAVIEAGIMAAGESREVLEI